MSDEPRQRDQMRALAHTLNNTLGPAMIAAESLGEHPDPKVARASLIILEALDRAVAAIRAVARPG